MLDTTKVYHRQEMTRGARGKDGRMVTNRGYTGGALAAANSANTCWLKGCTVSNLLGHCAPSTVAAAATSSGRRRMLPTSALIASMCSCDAPVSCRANHDGHLLCIRPALELAGAVKPCHGAPRGPILVQRNDRLNATENGGPLPGQPGELAKPNAAPVLKLVRNEATFQP